MGMEPTKIKLGLIQFHLIWFDGVLSFLVSPFLSVSLF